MNDLPDRERTIQTQRGPIALSRWAADGVTSCCGRKIEECEGCLFVCERCGKASCWCFGSADDHPSICDACFDEVSNDPKRPPGSSGAP